MSDVKVAITGLREGERPVAVIEIPLDEQSAYVEQLLALVFGNETAPDEPSK